MPNWCENIITLKGIDDDKRKEEILHLLKGPDSPPYYVRPHYQNQNEQYDSNNFLIPGETPLSFQKLIPLPKRFVMADHPNYKNENKTMADAMLLSESWGTKWTPEHVDVYENDGEIVFSFHTAWSPPIPVAKRISELVPDIEVEIKFIELGNMFAGKIIFVAGQETYVDDYNFEDEIREFAIEEMQYDEDFFDDWDD